MSLENISIEYAWQKLSGAITGMATSLEPLQTRIANAFIYHLIHIRPEENLPAESRLLYKEISAAFHAEKAVGDEGTAHASARKMSDEEAQEIAFKIDELFDHVAARYHSKLSNK